MGNLDLKDRKILFELDLNARQTDQEIAKKVGLSREAVRYRIHQMVESGTIHYFMTILNSMKLGFEWYRTFFKFQNLTLQKEEEIIGWLSKKASWITRVEGNWDLNTGIFVKNVYGYRDVINEFLLKYGAFVEKYDVAIVTRMWHYHRDYLLDRKQKTAPFDVMGFEENGNYSVEKIDEIDYRILHVLLTNARAKTVEIAKMAKTTDTVVRYRMKNLAEKGIILGFRPFLDVEKLGYMYFKIHFVLRDLDKEKKERLFGFIHHHPHTIHTTELVGGADLETELQVKSNGELYAHIKEIRTKFGDIIKDYSFMQYTHEYQFSYLPQITYKKEE